MTKPLLTVLNYSGGRQSSCLLWMVLRGDLKKPDNFIVLNADPGMENSDTYKYNEMMFKKCKEVEIKAITVPGPDLYKDLINLDKTYKTRLDNPPYWTRSKEGKKGRLRQKCTARYKIAPMDRYIRQLLFQKYGISNKSKRIGENIVRKWIGFSYDEVMRIKDPTQKYIYFEYPLIDLKMDNLHVLEYFKKNSLPMPPRSVCNACFANGLDTFRKMYNERPLDWAQAVNVDKSVRDWTQIGLHDEIYVSQTLIPLEKLAKMNFELKNESDQDKWSCDSGYCFT